jgi:hypothetical protein
MSYASWADVEAIWRTLSVDETATASALIAAAERMVAADFPDLAERIATGNTSAELVADVVATMVKRAMISTERLGVESTSESAGPFARAQKFSNPDGALYFTSDERRRLGGVRSSPRATRGWL